MFAAAGTGDLIVGVPTNTNGGTVNLTSFVSTTGSQAAGFPTPVIKPANATADGPPRGFGVDENGNVQIYEGSNNPALLTDTNGVFTATVPGDVGKSSSDLVNTIDNSQIGWSTTQTHDYYGGLAVGHSVSVGGKTYGPFVFVTDMLTGSATPNDTRGLIRIDLANYKTPNGSVFDAVERETDAENGIAVVNGSRVPLGVDFTNVTIGADGIVYATAPPNSFDKNWAVYEFNQYDPATPNTFSLLDPATKQVVPAISGTVPPHIDLIDPRGNGTNLTNVASVTRGQRGRPDHCHLRQRDL